MKWQFRRFHSQLLLFFLGLFTLIQLLGFVVTRQLSERDAHLRVTESLAIAGGVLEQQLVDRNTRLLEAGRLLAGDFAFKSAWSTRDTPTLLSMLNNHRNRLGADWMAFVDLDDVLVADTLQLDSVGQRFTHSALIDEAFESEGGEASGILFIHDRLFQVIILPLMSPFHEAWILIGFELDHRLVHQLQSFVRADLSIVRMDTTPPAVYVSTLESDKQVALQDSLKTHSFDNQIPQRISIQGDPYLSLAIQLNAENNIPLFALIQRDMEAILAPYRQLQHILALLFVAGVIATGLGVAILAKGIAGPLRKLALSTERIAAGDYQQHISSDRKDELGQLTHAFNHMAKGLAERDKVRDLLGKVVSPEIAHRLLSRDATLGGEDRDVTIMFTDCHGFTAFSESRAPQEVLEQLNHTLTKLTHVIENESGVVDKYIGDAVMALFGAPVEQPDAASRAVRAAMAIITTMQGREDVLQVGIGINTGRVVAGNMGSTNRLNYSVIGDNVNLASRLESLTRYYGVSILVSEYTREQSLEITYREIDRVMVKGKRNAVSIFEPLIGETSVALLQQHQRALEHYRAGEFAQALEEFQSLALAWSCQLYSIYCDRCQQYLESPPEPDWQGITRFETK
ncbi:adenylate/guanylate cyclase domain-containing protein [Nitrincola alkalisediminis]|uniref:adenylate/guanylate cyclase domain-containing protein n=1 Tax=Nitrincola alkalisediminis TaxID=1366656 RepID=UPI0018765FED|nr:adenylate/guanylate cyclase domain-containing protein [Nitrincola alkalisediminis]